MNRASLTVGLALMDVCWVVPWAVLFGMWENLPAGRPLLSAPSVLALVLVGAFSTHALGRRVAGSHPLRFGLACLGAIAASLAVRFDQFPAAAGLDWLVQLVGAFAALIGQLSPPVVAFACALYLWWRGVRLGAQTPGFMEVEGAFRWGIGRLVVFGFILALTTRASQLPGAQAATLPYLVGFFFVSLVTLALGRLESLRTRTRAPSINRQWLSVLLAVAAGVVLVALLLAQLVSFDVLVVATRPLFDLLGQALIVAIYVLVIPLAYVMQWIVFLFLSLVRANPNQRPPQPPQPADVDQALQQFFNQAIPPGLLLALKAAAAAALLLLAVWVVARSLARWRASSADAETTNEERDSVWDAQRMRSLLLSWLRGVFHRRRAPGVPVGTDLPSFAVTVASAPLPTARELYARLLALGSAAGAPRLVSATPFEHEPILASVLEPEASLAQLTAVYVRARYAEVPEPSEHEMAALADELARVQPKGARD